MQEPEKKEFTIDKDESIENKDNIQKDNNDLLKDYRTEDGSFDEKKLIQLHEDKKYFRSQISKLKNLPKDVKEYGKDFHLDEKYNDFVSEEENSTKINKIFEELDNLCMEKELSVERNHDMRRFILSKLEENGAIDLTSKEDKAIKYQSIVESRNKDIKDFIGEGTDINGWDEQLYSWLKTFCNSESEYKAHKELASTNPEWALSLNKIMKMQLGNKVPIINTDPDWSPEAWQKKFSSSSKEEQDRMLQERAEKIAKGAK